MGENSNDKQEPKKKCCGLAIASLITPVLMWDFGWLFAVIVLLIAFSDWPVNGIILLSFLLLFFSSALLIISSSPVGIILAVLSLISIKKSGGKLGGKRFAIEAIILSMVLVVLSFLLGAVLSLLALYCKELGGKWLITN